MGRRNTQDNLYGLDIGSRPDINSKPIDSNAKQGVGNPHTNDTPSPVGLEFLAAGDRTSRAWIYVGAVVIPIAIGLGGFYAASNYVSDNYNHLPLATPRVTYATKPTFADPPTEFLPSLAGVPASLPPLAVVTPTTQIASPEVSPNPPATAPAAAETPSVTAGPITCYGLVHVIMIEGEYPFNSWARTTGNTDLDNIVPEQAVPLWEQIQATLNSGSNIPSRPGTQFDAPANCVGYEIIKNQ